MNNPYSDMIRGMAGVEYVSLSNEYLEIQEVPKDHTRSFEFLCPRKLPYFIAFQKSYLLTR